MSSKERAVRDGLAGEIKNLEGTRLILVETVLWACDATKLTAAGAERRIDATIKLVTERARMVEMRRAQVEAL